jgi:hypothetical protein
LKTLELEGDKFLWDRSKCMRMVIDALKAATTEMKPYTKVFEAARAELDKSFVFKCMAVIPKDLRRLLDRIVDKAISSR